MRGACLAVAMRSAALATTCLCALLTAAALANAALIDYTAAPTPRNFVEARGLHDALRLPPLIVEACSTDIPRDPPGKFGEDYVAGLLGKVELLRLLDARGGTLRVNNFLQKSADAQHVLDTYRSCLSRIAPGWDKGSILAPATDTFQGWLEVANDIGKIPPLDGVPGTAGIPLCRGDDEGDWDMSTAYLIRIWALARDALHDRLGVLSFDRLQQEVASSIWLQGGPSPEDQVVCGHFPETENHQLMIETTRLLHNELLPPADVSNTGDKWVGIYDVSSNFDNNTNGLTAILHRWFDAWATHDFLEYNARSYSRFQLLGLLNVYDFSGDASLRRAAGAVLDLLAAKAAAESMSLERTAPFRRRAENEDNHLLGSDQVSAAMQTWVGNMAPTAELQSLGIVHVMALAATSTYRPPDVVTDVMLDPAHHDYLQTFDGQGQGEVGFGARDFTLSGGGVVTPCPYPDKAAPIEQAVVTFAVPIPGLNFFLGSKAGNECKGSGNDPGVAQRIVLLPRRPPRLHSADIPISDDVIHSDDRTISACIGAGIACASEFIVGGPQPKPNCRIERDLPDGDTTTALRYDGDCVNPDYAGLCYFVFIRRIETRTQPFSYLVTHLCDPASSTADRETLFHTFADYLAEGDGQPTRPTGCDAERYTMHASPFGTLDTCSYSIELTPPEPYGAIRPAPRVELIDDFDLVYTLTPSVVVRGPRAADGTLAQLLPGNTRLRFADPAAGEWVVDSIAGGTSTGSSASARNFTWDVTINSLGTVSGTVTSADYPAAVRRITVSAFDETKLQNDCTVTLPNGLKGCYRPGLLCGDPPVPCTTGTVTPIELPGAFFAYGTAPLGPGQGIHFAGALGAVDPTHEYVVTLCVEWYRFMTPDEYRIDPTGAGNPDAHENCPNDQVKPNRCVNPLICDLEVNPLTGSFPNISNKRRGRFP